MGASGESETPVYKTEFRANVLRTERSGWFEVRRVYVLAKDVHVAQRKVREIFPDAKHIVVRVARP